jgi:hypothetical protein
MDVLGSYNWDQFTDLSNSIQIWGARASVKYQPLQRLTFHATYERSSQPTMSFTGDRFNPLTETFSVYYIQDVAAVSCEYHFRENLLAWMNLTYRRLDFPEDGRTGLARLDNIYGGTVQVIYKFRPWLRFSVAGGYSRDDSTEVYEGFENITSQIYAQCAF